MKAAEMHKRAKELYDLISAMVARMFRQRSSLNEVDIAAFSVLSSAEFAAMSLETFAESLEGLEANGFDLDRQLPDGDHPTIPIRYRRRGCSEN